MVIMVHYGCIGIRLDWMKIEVKSLPCSEGRWLSKNLMIFYLHWYFLRGLDLRVVYLGLDGLGGFTISYDR